MKFARQVRTTADATFLNIASEPASPTSPTSPTGVSSSAQAFGESSGSVIRAKSTSVSESSGSIIKLKPNIFSESSGSIIKLKPNVSSARVTLADESIMPDSPRISETRSGGVEEIGEVICRKSSNFSNWWFKLLWPSVDAESVADSEKDSEAIKRWRRKALAENLLVGSKVLLICTLLIFMNRFLAWVSRTGTVNGKSMWPERTTLPVMIACFVGEVLLSVISAGLTAWNLVRSEAKVYVHHCALLCFMVYTLWMRVTPLEQTCSDTVHLGIESTETTFYLRAVDLDCGAHGQTYVATTLVSIFILHLVVPEFRIMIAMCVYLVIYIILISWYLWRNEERVYFNWRDFAIEFCILFCTYLVALYKKFITEKQQLLKYKLQDEKMKASNRLSGILWNMLPRHVLLRVVECPGRAIADRVDRASILFIEVVDFEQKVKSLPPEQLLGFLNRIFTHFDDICRATNVTKIETVGQEYVAAIGVSPDDVETERDIGHEAILGRLVRAATDILKLQVNYRVQFKMGMHTGPIVAGVIGQKLPRFRLFGDTMNMAARMMQKGQPGKLQFGEETREFLPVWVDVEARGPIELKGKGMISAYFLKEVLPISEDDLLSYSSHALSAGLSTHAFMEEMGKTFTSNGVSPRDRSPCASGESDLVGRCPSMAFAAVNETVKGYAFSEAFRVEMSVFLAGMPKNKFIRPVYAIKYFALKVYKQLGLDDVEFSSAQERLQWLKKFYNTLLYTPVAVRTDQHLTVISFIMAVEAFTATAVDVNGEPHKYYGNSRLPVYFACRFLIFASILCWRAKLNAWGGPFLNPRVTERWRLFDLCSKFVITFVMYDALTLESKVSPELTQSEIKLIHLAKPYRVALWPLMFMLSFMQMLSDLRCRCKTAVLFVVFTQGFLGIVQNMTFYLKFPVWWQLAMLCLGVLGVQLALHDEVRSLAEFDATRSIEASGARIASIVNTLMPPFVIKELQDSPTTLPSHHYRMATIAQSDLVGFTKLASTKTPEEVVDFISDLFRLFDDLTDEYKVYKVETIGDAYLAGQAGMPLTSTNRPLSVAMVATQMVRITQEWSEGRGIKINCRVGVHTDECTGGIVGAQMQRYHLFGKLLSVIDKLEATAPEGCVQMSSKCREAIDLQIKQERISSQVISLDKRELPQLVTSKGDIVDYEETGGPTYIVTNYSLEEYSVG